MRETTTDSPTSGRRQSKFTSNLGKLVGTLAALAVQSTEAAFTCTAGKWCSGSTYTTEDTYDFIDGT